MPAFDGDTRITTRFTLVPGSHFGVDTLSALSRAGARTLPWDEALRTEHDLVLAASPKGGLQRLSGPHALLPHGAGFNKTVGGEGSAGAPSGLDPHYLLADGKPWAELHGLAHEEQVARLAHHCPVAADRAAVVGDPTLDRVLASAQHRETYRDALGTGRRRLVVLTSTWGPESLMARRPRLPADLSCLLPHDAFQTALILHPNDHSRTGMFDLSRHLAPALAAGLVLSRPDEEWAALLVAADVVITDHGSTALYAAALGRPVIGAYDGGTELIPASPMATLLAAVPALPDATGLPDAIEAAQAVETRRLADSAFSQQHLALAQLRGHLYRLLRLDPPDGTPEARAFPPPSTAPTPPRAFAVRTEISGHRITVHRFPAHTSRPTHHLAAEHPAAGPRAVQSAALLWRTASARSSRGHSSTWTAAGWTAHVLAEAPHCRTAVAVLTPGRCLVRHRTAGLFSLRLEPERGAGRVAYADPSAVASAVHTWLGTGAAHVPPVLLLCDTGPVTVRAHLGEADPNDLAYEL
ncbi:translation initiation factor 2 [Streptomyces sp. NPDC006976]|uniref:translation initiation factor 2 n=1 Tax=Streptomyces sp. NPDC006976 TaxID=3154311 RepID=UPI0033F91394